MTAITIHTAGQFLRTNCLEPKAAGRLKPSGSADEDAAPEAGHVQPHGTGRRRSVEVGQDGLGDDGGVFVPPQVVYVGVGVDVEGAALVQRLQTDVVPAVAVPAPQRHHRQVSVVETELTVEQRPPPLTDGPAHSSTRHRTG